MRLIRCFSFGKVSNSRADALCKSSINLLTNQLTIVSVWMDKIERIYSPCVRRDAP